MHARTAFKQDGDITTWDSEFLGLTKREYFAAMAMQGLAPLTNLTVLRTAEIAVQMADELLKQLEENK